MNLHPQSCRDQVPVPGPGRAASAVNWSGNGRRFLRRHPVHQVIVRRHERRRTRWPAGSCPTPPIPRSDCTVTVDPPASARPPASASSLTAAGEVRVTRRDLPHRSAARRGTAAHGASPGPPGNPAALCGLGPARSPPRTPSSAAGPSPSASATPEQVHADHPGQQPRPVTLCHPHRPAACAARAAGSCSHAACHSAVPNSDSRYAGDSTAIVRSARVTPSCMPWIQLLPGTKSHACTSTWWPSSSSSQAIHSAHARSACV